jgi:hypothetical protein
MTLLLTLPVTGGAVSKCIVNGKTIYQKQQCKQGVAKPINHGAYATMQKRGPRVYEN